MNTAALLLISIATVSLAQEATGLGSKRGKPLCAGVVISGSVDPGFSESELRWLCGDPRSEAYKKIPPYQAEFHVRAFLERRGYTRAETRIENGVLHVKPGDPVTLESFEMHPSDPELEKMASRFRGQVLRPALLNSIEQALQRRLLESGYSCATIRTQATTSHLRIDVERGPSRSFGALQLETVTGLRPEAFVRFRPFKSQDTYDIRLLELYEKRLLRQNVVQGTYFQETCKGGPHPIEQSFLVGPPRTLRFGVGIDTENGPLVQASWRNHRFSDMASQLSLMVQASLSQQNISGRAELFVWPDKPRLALEPQARLSRIRTDTLTEITNTTGVEVARSWDPQGFRAFVSAGPAFVTNWFSTRSDEAFRSQTSVALLARTELRSNAYEIFDLHPQDGSLTTLSAEYRDPTLGFSERTLKLSWDGRWVRPLGFCGRGRCVGALRSSASNTWTSADSLDDLPPSLKTYLGGYDNLRGFGLRTLPENNGRGALTSLTGALELRGVDIFARNFEPFVFYDVGALGNETLSLDQPLYSAVGVGMRWHSPLGLVQGYIARPSTRGFYAYAAFGGEF